MKNTTNFLGRLLVSLLCITVVMSSCEGDNPFWEEDKEHGKSESSGDDIITNTSGGVTLTVSLRNLSMTGVAFYGEAKFAENNTANTFGILYSEQEVFTAATAEKIQIIDIYGTNYSVSTSSLKPGTTYYYTSYIQQGDLYKCGEIKSFTTIPFVAPTMNDASEVKAFLATLSGKVNLPSEIMSGLEEYGVQYSTSQDFASNVVTKKVTDLDSENNFSIEISPLTLATLYYYRLYIKVNGATIYGEPKTFTTLPNHPYTHQADLNISSASDLSSAGSANCYVVSEPGLYKFRLVKGNSTESVGDVSVAETLWETFGTSKAPVMGELISAITYHEAYIAFQTADTFKEGNAVIAAKDASGNILWSWHIWLTDQPQGQEYYNNAGYMMDRNLGATSAIPGDVGALGLLYQWGRKDPFLGSSSISESTQALSTGTWITESGGSQSLANLNPMTFYTSISLPNKTWHTKKTIYDPCPPGWCVPNGAANSEWSKATRNNYLFNETYDSFNKGINFYGRFGSSSTIWYPASGYLVGGSLSKVGYYGYYWSCYRSSGSDSAYNLEFDSSGCVDLTYTTAGLFGCSVRCLQESE